MTTDGRGGLWLLRSDGIRHRTAERGPDGPVLADGALGHLASDPRNGDLVYDSPEGTLRRVTIAGVESVVATDLPGNVTSLDVASDGIVYVAAGPEDIQRIDDDGTTPVVQTDRYVEALAVEPTGSLVYYTAGTLYRFRSGVSTRIAGTGTSCLPPDPCGDSGPALDASLGDVVLLDVATNGAIFIGELFGRVRAVIDGSMVAVAGAWTRCYLATVDCGEEQLGPIALLDNVVSMSIDADTLYLVDERGDGRGNRLLRLGDAIHPFPWLHQGYRMIASDGGVFTFGWSPFQGSTGDIPLQSPIVAGVSNGARGYWFVAGDGGVFAFGDAPFYGSIAGRTLAPVVDMVRRSDGAGYWILDRDGHVWQLGPEGTELIYTDPDRRPKAAIVARPGGTFDVIAERPPTLPTLNQPIVAAHTTENGNGTWLVAADGGVFTQGDAPFFGSTGAMRLNQPVLDLVPLPDDQGYWLIAADGGVFTFGIARFMGSMGAVRLNQPVVAGVAGPTASG